MNSSLNIHINADKNLKWNELILILLLLTGLFTINYIYDNNVDHIFIDVNGID